MKINVDRGLFENNPGEQARHLPRFNRVGAELALLAYLIAPRAPEL